MTNKSRRALPRIIIYQLLIFLCAVTNIGWFWQDSIVKKNKEGTKLYKEGKIDESLSKWRDAQIEEPDNKGLHYNIGNALHQQKKYEDAFNEYEKSLETKDASLQSKAYYNIGNTHYRMGKLDEAIEDYKKCLDINPVDEDAKYNIEFVREKIKENLQKQEGKSQEEQQSPAQEQEPQENQSDEQGDEGGGTKDEGQGMKDEGREGEEAQMPKDGKEMSKEDAMRILDALKDDEKDLQKQLRTHQGQGRYRVDKDW